MGLEPASPILLSQKQIIHTPLNTQELTIYINYSLLRVHRVPSTFLLGTHSVIYCHKDPTKGVLLSGPHTEQGGRARVWTRKTPESGAGKGLQGRGHGGAPPAGLHLHATSAEKLAVSHGSPSCAATSLLRKRA